MRPETAITLAWAGFVVVLIGTMLPWVHVERHTQRVEFSGRVQGFQERTVGGFSISGFRGKASVAGLSLPGWTVVLAAFLCAIQVSASTGISVFSWALCVYGLLHVGFMATALGSTPNMSPSIGILVVVGGFAMQIWSLLAERRAEPTSVCHTNDA